MSIEKKLLRNVVMEKILEKVEENSSVSAYFSPKKTRNRIKIEFEEKEQPAKKSVAVSKEKKAKKRDGDQEHHKEIKTTKWEPKHWKEILENIQEMRQEASAPVDTMGCHKCSDESADEKTKRYHVLVALMLSSQTKDQITFDAMARLKKSGLTPDRIVDIDDTVLEEMLKPVSFFRNKAKYLKKTSKILIDEYNADIPNTIDDLIKLPGVGPKMAHICMNSAWNIVTGIGVDVHVHRISNRLKWVRKETKIPEKTREELELWLPNEYWEKVNHLLVGFGQTICTATNPKCNLCLNKNICPASQAKKKK